VPMQEFYIDLVRITKMPLLYPTYPQTEMAKMEPRRREVHRPICIAFHA
jgi:hypothetical protein